MTTPESKLDRLAQTAQNRDTGDAERARMVSALPVEDDATFELKLRPRRLQEFIGQKENQGKPAGGD